jgi:hypothetical protein
MYHFPTDDLGGGLEILAATRPGAVAIALVQACPSYNFQAANDVIIPGAWELSAEE